MIKAFGKTVWEKISKKRSSNSGDNAQAGVLLLGTPKAQQESTALTKVDSRSGAEVLAWPEGMKLTDRPVHLRTRTQQPTAPAEDPDWLDAASKQRCWTCEEYEKLRSSLRYLRTQAANCAAGPSGPDAQILVEDHLRALPWSRTEILAAVVAAHRITAMEEGTQKSKLSPQFQPKAGYIRRFCLSDIVWDDTPMDEINPRMKCSAATQSALVTDSVGKGTDFGQILPIDTSPAVAVISHRAELLKWRLSMRGRPRAAALKQAVKKAAKRTEEEKKEAVHDTKQLYLESLCGQQRSSISEVDVSTSPLQNLPESQSHRRGSAGAKKTRAAKRKRSEPAVPNH